MELFPELIELLPEVLELLPEVLEWLPEVLEWLPEVLEGNIDFGFRVLQPAWIATSVPQNFTLTETFGFLPNEIEGNAEL